MERYRYMEAKLKQWKDSENRKPLVWEDVRQIGKMIKTILVWLAVISAFVVEARDFEVKKGVPYRPGAERCVMDIYYPANETGGSLPVVVWFHGGGLTGGHWEIPEELKTGEYVVVAPGYRLLPDAQLSDCIDDAAGAVSWVMDSIADYGGDTSHIFVSGHSAGGYLTSMIGLDKKWLNKYGKDADAISGLIPFSGQVITHFAQRESKGLSPLTPVVDEFAPLYHVRKDAPPYIIITGDKEMELYGRYEENAYMWRMMKLTGHPNVEIYQLEGYNHGDMASPAFHILKNSVREIMAEKESAQSVADSAAIIPDGQTETEDVTGQKVLTNRVAVGYNLELNRFCNDKVNVGNGVMAQYAHSFSVSRKNSLYVDFGVKLDFARVGNVSYWAADSDFGYEADHYTDYTVRFPASLAWRKPVGDVCLMPYAGLQLGVRFHHEPNSNDGKVYFRIPLGAQAGFGAIYKRWYYGIEGQYVGIVFGWNVNLNLSVGYLF